MHLVPHKSSGLAAFPPQNAPSPEETFRTSINVFAKCVRSEWRGGEKETGNRKRRGGEKEMRKREEGGEEMTEKSNRRRRNEK